MKIKSKKIISIFLSLCIIVSLLSVTSINANATIEIIESDDYRYFIDEEGYIRIEDYIGDDTELVIPSTIDGHIVKYLGSIPGGRVPTSHTDITSVTVPDTVTEISKKSFAGCKTLTTVHLPDSLEVIENGTFSYCENLTSINIPNSLKVIGDEAFRNCKKLTSVTLPESVTTIGQSAFRGCALTTINIPDNIKSIDNWAFYECNINKLVLNKNIEDLGYLAFGNVYTIYVTKNVVNFYPLAFDDGVLCGYCRIYYEGSREEWANLGVSDLDETWVNVYCNQSLEKPLGFSSVVADKFNLELTHQKGDIQSGEIVLPEGTYEFNIHKGDAFNILNGNNIMGYNKTINDSTRGKLTCNPRYKSKTKLVATGGTYSFEFNTKTNALSVKRTGDIPQVYLSGINLSISRMLNLPLKPISGTSLYTASVYLPNNFSYQFKLVSNGVKLGATRITSMHPYEADRTVTLSADGRRNIDVSTQGGFVTFIFDQATNEFTTKKAIPHSKDIEIRNNIHIASGNFELELDDNNGQSDIATGIITLEKGIYPFKLYNHGVAYGSNSIYHNKGTRTLNSSFILPSVLVADGGRYKFNFEKSTGRLFIHRV